MKFRALVLAAALLVTSASAAKLPVKTIEVMADGSIREILDQVGKGMTRAGGGQIVRRSITKIPGKIPWGGVLTWGPGLVANALDYFYNEAKNEASGSGALDDWFRDKAGGFPPPRTVTNIDGTFTPTGVYCQGYRGDGVAVTVWAASNNKGDFSTYSAFIGQYLANGEFQHSELYSSYYKANTDSEAAKYCRNLGKGKDLSDVISRSPDAATALGDILRKYANDRPDDYSKSAISPLPTRNQMADDLEDPTIISVPNGRYSDGDYLKKGYVLPSGNRASPLDGNADEPWVDSPNPVDIDDDNIPDWRDPDDNGDGVPDDEQSEADQKAPPGSPGYGRRVGSTSSSTTTRDEPLPGGGNRRTITTVETRPNGDQVKRVVVIETRETKTYEPPAPGSPSGTPGNITTVTNTTTTTTTTTTTINNVTNTTTNTTTNTNTTTGPAPSPTPGDGDGDGTPDPDDPAPEDPTVGGKKDDTEDRRKACGAAGREWDAVNSTCGGEDKEKKCKAKGGEWDELAETCGKKKSDESTPDECGDFSVKRLLVHTGAYLKDVIVPCEPPDWGQFKTMLDGKFPFSTVAAMNNMFKTEGGGGNGTNPLPTKLGPFTLDFSFASAFFAFIKVGFRALLFWFLGVWLLDRLSGQVVLS